MSEIGKLQPKVSDNYVDYSGIMPLTKNPYDALIDASRDNPKEIQDRYQTHRLTRNAQQRTRLLDPGFSGVSVDPVLARLLNPEEFSDFKDPRHCLVFWARPPESVKALISAIQHRLRATAPNLWLMPADCLHMTTLEVTHSLTAPEIDTFVQTLLPSAATITDYTVLHRARLVKPMIGYDASALALSFVPACGEGAEACNDAYTYHHLRRDLYGLITSAGVTVASRYTIPTSHITIARFVTQRDFLREEKESSVFDSHIMNAWVDTIEGINAWLEQSYWPAQGRDIPEGGQWIVGQEKGLDFRKGTLWYGGGETIRLGAGF
ncbi:transport between ER and Golgi ATPase protein [Lambiella insularis]|nr:transport between ER and Golgi ATPase protein [Lambiella insularis]